MSSTRYTTAPPAPRAAPLRALGPGALCLCALALCIWGLCMWVLVAPLTTAQPEAQPQPDTQHQAEAQAWAPPPEDAIRARLQRADPKLRPDSVQPSPAPGLYELVLADGDTVLYATPDGAFFVTGNLYAVGEDGLVNLSEQRRDTLRRDLLAAIPREEMIIFPAAGETRGAITVFTDVDCYYCQKLHQEVPALNAAGVEVRYLAYPRAGIGSESYRKIASAWCARDPQWAITTLKNLQPIEDNVCDGNPVAGQFALGGKVGVRGTPALLLDNGQLHPGYRDAEALIALLGLR